MLFVPIISIVYLNADMTAVMPTTHLADPVFADAIGIVCFLGDFVDAMVVHQLLSPLAFIRRLAHRHSPLPFLLDPQRRRCRLSDRTGRGAAATAGAGGSSAASDTTWRTLAARPASTRPQLTPPPEPPRSRRPAPGDAESADLRMLAMGVPPRPASPAAATAQGDMPHAVVHPAAPEPKPDPKGRLAPADREHTSAGSPSPPGNRRISGGHETARGDSPEAHAQGTLRTAAAASDAAGLRGPRRATRAPVAESLGGAAPRGGNRTAEARPASLDLGIIGLGEAAD